MGAGVLLAAGGEGLLVGGVEVEWDAGHPAEEWGAGDPWHGTWGPPGRERGGLPPGRPPARAARLISMGEGRWRRGSAGRAGTSLAGPAGRAETQSASDGGGPRPFTRRGGPGAGGEEFPPPGRRIAPGPGGARPPCAPDLEPL